MDYKLIKLIERVGYVNEKGIHIYGTVALLHALHCPVKDIDPYYVRTGKTYLEKYLSA